MMDFMRTGGFPRIVLTGDIDLAREYLDRIIYKDILGRERVKHPEAVRNLVLFLLSNVGKEFSYRSLRDVCGVKHENTVKDYIVMLKNAYLVYTINRYHASLKVQESYGKKVYAIDPAFIYLGKRFGEDYGRILENVVLIQLLKRGSHIYFGKNSKELDFILCKGTKPQELLNVTYHVEDNDTRVRECSSLLYFMNKMNIRGSIISMYPFKVPDEIEFHLAHRYLK